MHLCVHMLQYKCEVQKLVLSFHYMGSRDRIQVIRLGSQHQNPLKYFTDIFFFLFSSLPLSLSPSLFPLFPSLVVQGNKPYAFLRGRRTERHTSGFKLKQSSCPQVPWSTRLTFGISAVIIANLCAVITFCLSSARKVIKQYYYSMCSESIWL